MITSCRVCEGKLSSLGSYNPIPLVNNFTSDKTLYQNAVGICVGCSLIQHRADIADEKIYTKNGYMFGSFVDLPKYNFYKSAIKCAEKFLKKSELSLVEIGGGTGWLGQKLISDGAIVSYANFDPVSCGTENNIDVFFDHSIGLINADIVLVSNVLANICGPKSLVEAVLRACPKALYIFSVQDSEEIFRQGYLDLIFHEHRFYFSVDTFKALFDGLVDVEIFVSPLHHRSLTAANFPLNFAQKAKPSIDDVVDLFHQGQKQYVSRIEEIVVRCNKQDKQVVGVGCGPRSIKTIYDLLNMNKNLFDKVLEPEDSPKIGSKLPCTAVKIIGEKSNFSNDFRYIWFPFHIDVPDKFQNLLV